MKGRFIVIEGIDGCGKTTQIDMISKWLPDSGLILKHKTFIKTREPGGSLLGQKIRELILTNNQVDPPSYLAELLLYFADRAEHLAKTIVPELEKGNWVLSDRFSGSTLAYQGYGRGIDIKIIKELEKIVCKGIKPDMTFLLEISPEQSIDRRKDKIPDRIESEGINFLQKVNEGFKLIANENEWEIISESNDLETISNKIKNCLLHKFSLKNE